MSQGLHSRSSKNSPKPPERYRLFFALPVPPDIASQLSEKQRLLRGNWRAVAPEQMHITLAYLAGVPPQQLDALKRLGKQLANTYTPQPIALRGTGYFPNEGSPRVWFVKAEAPQLRDLAAELRQQLASLDLRLDDKNFNPHVTLARKKGPAPRVAPLLFEQTWTATQLVLVRSILRKTGPIYETRGTFSFDATATTQTDIPDIQTQNLASEEIT